MVAATLYYQTEIKGQVQVQPETEIGGIRLGMSEPEVTLAYGRKADCPTYVIPGTETKVLRFDNLSGQPCSTRVALEMLGGIAKVTSICVPDGHSEGRHIEATVLKEWGQPASISINADATTKFGERPVQPS